MNSALATPPSVVRPPCFPARPVNGGPLEKALPKSGDWYYKPKYNGWRTLVHVPTGTRFNRKLERLSIEKEFTIALHTLHGLWLDKGSDARSVNVPEWLDCEGIGVLMLFRYGFSQPTHEESTGLALEGPEYDKAVRISTTALVIIVLGFAFQILATWI